MDITKNGAELNVDGNSVSGYLIQFGNESQRDLDGQFFSPRTFFGYATELPVFYHHGFHSETQKTVLGKVSIRKDEKGLFVQGNLGAETIKTFFEDEQEKARRYAQLIQALGLKSLLGWSSGTARYTVRVDDTGEIRQWILCEASLTPTPADWRNNATFKSILTAHIPEMQEAVNTPEIKAGAELSKMNRDVLRKIQAKIKDAHDEFASFVAKFDAPEEITTQVVTTQSKYANTINFINRKKYGK